MTDPVNNLTSKLGTLTTTLGGKLDDILTKLDALGTKLDTLASQTGDYSSITTAITNLRSGYTLEDLAVRLDSIWDNAGQLLLATGSFESNPANYSVKELLSLLQTSLDATPTDKSVNQPILPGTWTRQVSWIAYPDQVTWQDTLYNAYIPVFSAVTQPFRDAEIFKHPGRANDPCCVIRDRAAS